MRPDMRSYFLKFSVFLQIQTTQIKYEVNVKIWDRKYAYAITFFLFFFSQNRCYKSSKYKYERKNKICNRKYVYVIA